MNPSFVNSTAGMISGDSAEVKPDQNVEFSWLMTVPAQVVVSPDALDVLDIIEQLYVCEDVPHAYFTLWRGPTLPSS